MRQLLEPFSTLLVVVVVIVLLLFVFSRFFLCVGVLAFTPDILSDLVLFPVVPFSFRAIFCFLFDGPSSSTSSECDLFIVILCRYELSPIWVMSKLFGLDGVRSSGRCLVQRGVVRRDWGCWLHV